MTTVERSAVVAILEKLHPAVCWPHGSQWVACADLAVLARSWFEQQAEAAMREDYIDTLEANLALARAEARRREREVSG